MYKRHINTNTIENCNGVECIKIRRASIDKIMLYRDNYFVTISYRTYDDGGMSFINIVRLVVSCTTVIIDRFGRRKCPSDLQVGMLIDVNHSVFMTMSLPPQAVAYRIVINL